MSPLFKMNLTEHRHPVEIQYIRHCKVGNIRMFSKTAIANNALTLVPLFNSVRLSDDLVKHKGKYLAIGGSEALDIYNRQRCLTFKPIKGEVSLFWTMKATTDPDLANFEIVRACISNKVSLH